VDRQVAVQHEVPDPDDSRGYSRLGGEVEETNNSFSFSPEKQVVFIKEIPDR
jgi:hypothetical protein